MEECLFGEEDTDKIKMSFMKFYEIVEHLRIKEKAHTFLSNELPEVDLSLIDIYLHNELNIYSEVKLVNYEELPEDIRSEIVIEFQGVKLVNLCLAMSLQEMVEEYSKLVPPLSSEKIATNIIEYIIKDA